MHDIHERAAGEHMLDTLRVCTLQKSIKALMCDLKHAAARLCTHTQAQASLSLHAPATASDLHHPGTDVLYPPWPARAKAAHGKHAHLRGKEKMREHGKKESRRR